MSKNVTILPGAPAALTAAYEATTYRVWLPGGALDMRIGETNPSLDAWLAGMGASSCAVVSAVNPASRQLPVEENVARHARLCREMEELGYAYFPGEASADAGDWSAEAGLLVLEVSEGRARELGRDQGQNAVVWVALGEAPRLLWCL